MAEAFFENLSLSEILKSYYNQLITERPIYFYKDKNMNEIDLLLEYGRTLFLIKIKKHAI